MRSLITIAFLLGVAFAAPKRLATLHPPTGPVIENEYIVIFNELVTDEQVDSHHHKLSSIMAQFNDTQLRVMHKYHIGKFRGYSAHLNERTLVSVRGETIVKEVHLNQVASIYQGECVKQEDAPWGLARVTQVDYVDNPLNTYEYSSESKMGDGVDVYIIDTGIFIEHNDFDGRAKWGVNFIERENDPMKDGNGHGTHVAGTVMGTKYGIAKKATSIAVRVLGDGGSGSWDGVIAGINWVADQHSSGNKKSVANMSLGGGKNDAVNAAVEAAAKKGVHFALSAGNNGGDSCNNSPASSDVTSVAASDSEDYLATFSNAGDCAEIIAPGVAIDSAWITDPNSSSTLSGTSMASPHVAGVMAKILSDTDEKLSQQALEDIIVGRALKDRIKLRPNSRQELKANLLLHEKCS